MTSNDDFVVPSMDAPVVSMPHLPEDALVQQEEAAAKPPMILEDEEYDEDEHAAVPSMEVPTVPTSIKLEAAPVVMSVPQPPPPSREQDASYQAVQQAWLQSGANLTREQRVARWANWTALTCRGWPYCA